ncbi:MAG: hypothetical protein KDJ69_06670, partial [Nitratireductor sp.]|nr:hypothetical protein [Nitratireductor sp.]
LAFIETIDWTHLDAVHVFAFDAFVVDDVGHDATGEERITARLPLRCDLAVTTGFAMPVQGILQGRKSGIFSHYVENRRPGV